MMAAAIEGKRVADAEWQPLPALWPEPAVWTDVEELMLLVFTQDGVPTWEVNRRAKPGSSRDDRIASGTALIYKILTHNLSSAKFR